MASDVALLRVGQVRNLPCVHPPWRLNSRRTAHPQKADLPRKISTMGMPGQCRAEQPERRRFWRPEPSRHPLKMPGDSSTFFVADSSPVNPSDGCATCTAARCSTNP